MRAARPFRALIAALLAGLALEPAQAPSPSLPDSMAAAGDSITRGFDVGPGCVLKDCPQYSWATGDDPSVHSHYRRLLAAHPALAGHLNNNARTGARMADLDQQLALAAAQQASYVVIGMGANDVCAQSLEGMTPASQLGGQLEAALAHLMAARPGTRVYLSSIPNLLNLWQVLHENPSAETVWRTFRLCPSLLGEKNSPGNRLSVLLRIEADNQAMARVCAGFLGCRWDGWAAFRYRFRSEDISSVDYFHPSLLGQTRVADLTWAAGFWPYL